MSYIYLQELDKFNKKAYLCATYENMHTLPNTERTIRIQEINSRVSPVMVQTMREGLPKEDLRGQPRKRERAIRELAGKIRGKVCREQKKGSSQVLRCRNREKIQHDQARGAKPYRFRRLPLQGVRPGIRPHKTITQEEFGSLPQNRKGARIPLLAMQHRGWTRQ